jgi:DNA-binding NarL/FixJ family response regulator
MESPILIVCTDLIFSTKITGTAKSLGRPFAVARSLEKLRDLLAANASALVIIDLAATGIDPLDAIRLAKTPPAPDAPKAKVVTFLSHLQTDLAAAARQAGADQVLARSAFTIQLPHILAASQ